LNCAKDNSIKVKKTNPQMAAVEAGEASELLDHATRTKDKIKDIEKKL